LADAHGITWAPHISTNTALYVSASVHPATATPNLAICEGGRSFRGALGNELIAEPITWKPGWIEVPGRELPR